MNEPYTSPIICGTDFSDAARHAADLAVGEPIEIRLRKMVPVEAGRRAIRTEVEVVENDDAAAAICEAADRFDADLVCIGSHGRSGVLAAALGSVAHQVARSAHPVLVVSTACS